MVLNNQIQRLSNIRSWCKPALGFGVNPISFPTKIQHLSNVGGWQQAKVGW